MVHGDGSATEMWPNKQRGQYDLDIDNVANCCKVASEKRFILFAAALLVSLLFFGRSLDKSIPSVSEYPVPVYLAAVDYDLLSPRYEENLCLGSINVGYLSNFQFRGCPY